MVNASVQKKQQCRTLKDNPLSISPAQGVDPDLDEHDPDLGSRGGGSQGRAAHRRVGTADFPAALLLAALAARCPHRRSTRLHDHCWLRKSYHQLCVFVLV